MLVFVICKTLKSLLDTFTSTLNIKSCKNRESSLRGSLLFGGEKGRTGRHGRIGGCFGFVGAVAGGFELATKFEAGTALIREGDEVIT